MADEPTTEAPAPETPAPESPTPTPETPSDPTPTEAKEPQTPLSGDAPPPEFSWPEDWRERLSGEDTKLAERLKRYSNPAAVVKALDEAQSALAKRDEISFEAQTDEEKARLRKRLGVPDDLGQYHIKTPVEKMSDGEKEQFDRFRGFFHENNIPPPMAQKLVDFYYDQQSADEQALQEVWAENRRKNETVRKEKHGPDYKRNITVAKTFMEKYAGGPEGRDGIASLMLADGTPLGDHPVFFDMMVEAGLSTLDDDALVTSGDFGGGNIEEEYNKLLDMRFSNPKEYRRPENQEKMLRLATLRDKRKGRG